MKKIFIKLSIISITSILLLGFTSTYANAEGSIIIPDAVIIEDVFPDINLQKIVREYFDTNKDGGLSDEEMDAVESIDSNIQILERGKLKNLDGINYFKNLKSINLPNEEIDYFFGRNNLNLTSINLTNNNLKWISINGLTNLESLNVSNNHLPSINLDGTDNLNSDLVNLENQTIETILTKTLFFEDSNFNNLFYFETESEVDSNDESFTQIPFLNKIENNIEYTNFFKLNFILPGSELANILKDPNQSLYYTYINTENKPTMEVQVKFSQEMILTNLSLDEAKLPKTDYIQGDDLDLSIGNVLASTYKDFELPSISIPLNDSNINVSGYDKNKIGKQTLTVSYATKCGGTLTTTYDIIVSAKSSEETVKPKRLSISPSFNIVTKNRTKQLSIKVYPKNATISELTWTSSNTNVASVDENGKVTGHRFGITTITATDSATGVKGKILVLVF